VVVARNGKEVKGAYLIKRTIRNKLRGSSTRFVEISNGPNTVSE
jgi:hypothetical protein